MNGSATKKYLILAAISLVLSLAIVRWHGVGNVSFCQFAPGCHGDQPIGTLTERVYGFPLAYKKTTSFRPNNGDEKKPNYAGYSETSIENQAFSIPSVLVSTLFWFGLLHLLSSFVWRSTRGKSQEQPDPPRQMAS